MALASESGFGARLQNAQTLKTFIESFANFNPPKSEDSVEEFEKLLNQCAEINTNIASFTQSYTLAVKSRSDIFNGNQASNIKLLLSPISKYVQAQYGKDSREYSSIATIIGRMRNAKGAKTAANSQDEVKDSISQSELSFGSLLQNFKDLVASLEQLANFNPANDLIKIKTLKDTIELVGKLNQEVILRTLPISQAREQRKTLFDDLNQRAQRIKSYTSATYGNKSPEYKAISKLKI